MPGFPTKVGGETMPGEDAELGQRIRELRESMDYSQADVAERTSLNRTAVSDIENGRRGVTSVELRELAEAFGVRVSDLFEEDGLETSDIVAAFRRDPDLEDEAGLEREIREYVRICSTITDLEERLGRDPDRPGLELYRRGSLHTQDRAVHHGAELAKAERGRLGLEDQPIPDLVDIVESEGVRVGQSDLPDGIYGLSFEHPDAGYIVVVNENDPDVRKRFSVAHEYCHVLVDLDEGPVVSRRDDDGLQETRANAFAARFLLPPRALREQLDELGVDAGDVAVLDAAQIAHRYGLSYRSTVYLLHNIGEINASKRDALLEKERSANRARQKLWGDEPSFPETSPLSSWIVNVAVSAYREDIISRRKLETFASEAGIEEELADALFFEDDETVEPVSTDPI